MPLPGKFCIGILEEDNPFKSYFRFKPLLFLEQGRYEPCDESVDYPEDGCIRIVPDKNESGHFKIRMRRMGMFAVVDLREHPGENDKIRANKNYRSDGFERNACIIYSDVVREPARDMVLSLIERPAEDALNAPLDRAPATNRVLLCENGTPQNQVYSCTYSADQPELLPHLTCEDTLVSLEDYQIFTLPCFSGEELRFAVRSPGAEASAPEPVKPQPAPVQEAPRTLIEPSAAPQIESAPRPPFVDVGLLKQLLSAQTGLNPRRGRSLQEVVDDKWRHSRLEQLGAPVNSISGSQPASTPAERALNAIRDAWNHLDQRDELIRSLTQIQDFDVAVNARLTAVRESALADQLNELEAQRLALLDDLEKLRRGRTELRETLKREIRADEAEAFADAVQKTRDAQAEQARCEQAAEKARVAAECAEDALNALADGRFEKELNDFAIRSHSVELLRRLDTSKPAPEPKRGVEISADALIDRTLRTFAASGFALDRTQAVNLLICAAQGACLTLTGPSGCGKTETVRLLARALGTEDARYLEFEPGVQALTDRADALAPCDSPAVILLDDANLANGDDLYRGLSLRAGRDYLLCATLQDDGRAVPAYAFDRAFTLRLSPEAPDAPWRSAEAAPFEPLPPVSLAALRMAFTSSEPLPEALIQRMSALRQKLGAMGIRLSRRTLDEMWRFCAAAIAHMSLEPSAIFDLAFVQRALPSILAGAPIDALQALPKLLEDMPTSLALLRQPMPIQI